MTGTDLEDRYKILNMLIDRFKESLNHTLGMIILKELQKLDKEKQMDGRIGIGMLVRDASREVCEELIKHFINRGLTVDEVSQVEVVIRDKNGVAKARSVRDIQSNGFVAVERKWDAIGIDLAHGPFQFAREYDKPGDIFNRIKSKPTTGTGASSEQSNEQIKASAEMSGADTASFGTLTKLPNAPDNTTANAPDNRVPADVLKATQSVSFLVREALYDLNSKLSQLIPECQWADRLTIEAVSADGTVSSKAIMDAKKGEGKLNPAHAARSFIQLNQDGRK